MTGEPDGSWAPATDGMGGDGNATNTHSTNGTENTPNTHSTQTPGNADGGASADSPTPPQSPVAPPTESPSSLWRSLQALAAYLPMGAHEPESGYTGLLSYSAEWHALLLGLSAGITAASTGNTQRVMGVVTAALGLGRGQQSVADTAATELAAEPWYALAGAGIGFYGTKLIESDALKNTVPLRALGVA